MPKVSIIVPVYNVEKFLSKCLDSIMAQTFTDFEAVLIDDGSTDKSGQICDDYAEKDSRFVVVHKQNEGVAKARITAFEHSKGDFITFVDSDDGEDQEENKDDIQDFIAKHFFYDDKIGSYGMNIYLWTKMVRREFVLDALKAGEGMWYAEDQIGVFHMLQCCQKLVILPDRLYCYVQHEGQAMRKYDMSLWRNLVLLMEKYEKLDNEGIYHDGIRKRTWRHIDYTIFNKMVKAGVPKDVFCTHLSEVRSWPYIDKFFAQSSIDFNIKENVKYWLLKLKQYSLFYTFAARQKRI